MKQRLAILLCALAACSAPAQGYILWNENVNGPLGNSSGAPTSLGFLNQGTNSILGATETEPVGNGWLGHADFFRFSLSPGQLLSGISLTVDNQALSLWLGTADFGTELGYRGGALNGALFPQIGIQSLGSGNYGMYLANLDLQPFTTVSNYRLDFIVAPVPEPSTWALLALGGLVFWATRPRPR